MERLGLRIKEKREALNLLVTDLARQVEVTPSLISQIERAKAYPSIVTLKKIANALHTTVGELIGENEIQASPHLKFSEKKFAKKNRSGTVLYLLSHHFPNKQIEAYLIDFTRENSNSSDIMTSKFPGQEFCFVLKGSFSVRYSNEDYHLSTGDSFYFNSSREHFFKNNDTHSQLLWVITPQHAPL